MAGFDLSGARRVVERGVLLDSIEVTRGAPGEGGLVLDPVTGELVPGPVSSPVVVCTDTPALVQPSLGYEAVPALEGAQAEEEERGPYQLLVGLDAPPILTQDIVRVLTSRLDPQLVGERFRVTARGDVATLTVVRKVWLQRMDEEAP